MKNREPRSSTAARRSARLVRGVSVRAISLFVLTLLVPATVVSLDAQRTPSAGSAAIDTVGYPKAAEIRGNSVNIRTTPSTNARVIIQLPDRTRVLATGRNGEWVRFSLPPEVKVWVSQKYLEPVAGDTRVRVRGNAINLRATAGTKYQAIGQVSHGTLLRPTGHVDTLSAPETGPWVEVDAPPQASGWIFGKYIAVGRSLNAAEVQAFYPPPRKPAIIAQPPRDPPRDPVTGEPRPVTAPDGGRPTTSSAPNRGEEKLPAEPTEPPKMIEFHFPRVGAEPLNALFERLNLEYTKSLGEWRFEPIIDDLIILARTSEDAVVAQHAREWAQLVIEHWLPTQRLMEQIEAKKLAAERARREAQAKEEQNELEKPPVNTPREKEFLAVGWVATLGKYRKVDGTHRLLKGNKLVFYLKSEQLKLDDYVNKRVGIRGVIQQQPPGAGAQLILVTGIKILSD